MITIAIPDNVLVNDLSRAFRTIGLAVVPTGPSVYEAKPIVSTIRCSTDNCERLATVTLTNGHYCSFHAMDKIRA